MCGAENVERTCDTETSVALCNWDVASINADVDVKNSFQSEETEDVFSTFVLIKRDWIEYNDTLVNLVSSVIEGKI